jgi:hypothetical protein
MMQLKMKSVANKNKTIQHRDDLEDNDNEEDIPLHETLEEPEEHRINYELFKMHEEDIRYHEFIKRTTISRSQSIFNDFNNDDDNNYDSYCYTLNLCKQYNQYHIRLNLGLISIEIYCNCYRVKRGCFGKKRCNKSSITVTDYHNMNICKSDVYFIIVIWTIY